MKVYVVLAPDVLDNKDIDVLDEVFSSKERAEDYVNSRFRPMDYTIIEKDLL